MTEQQSVVIDSGLAQRIRRGHELLWLRWDQIRACTSQGEQAEAQSLLLGWDKGKERLSIFAIALSKGDGRCVYDGAVAPTRPCLVCAVPNSKWRAADCPAFSVEIGIQSQAV